MDNIYTISSSFIKIWNLFKETQMIIDDIVKE